MLTRRSKPPSKAIYDQDLPDGGYGYLTTRDGTELAINVHLPGPAEQGPYPTLVEYSGYGYADPSGPQSGIQPVAELLGYAVVDVNMRGTGCSGGAFDYYEPLQSLDGYDVVETVARQPWALHGKVGMLGISYGGISQLFVAATRPPSLAAITPLSVIDNTQTTLYPGRHPQHGLRPRVGGGPGRRRPARGARRRRPAVGVEADRGRRPDLQGEPGPPPGGGRPDREDPRNDYYRPRVVDPLADELRRRDRGPGLPRLPVDRRADRRPLPGARPALHRNEAEVVHVHKRGPLRLARPGDLQPLVRLPRAVRRAGGLNCSPAQCGPRRPALYASLMGVQGVGLPDDPIQQQPDYDSALAAFEAQPPVRVLFENGAGGARRGRRSRRSRARSSASSART